ncbi:MAG: signal peptidase II [bacterium]|nr:signal peptidase II [bacterium]
MTPRSSVWPWVAGVLGLLTLDQVSKVLVRRALPLYESVPLIGDEFLKLTHVQNPGVIFGLRVLGPTLLAILGCLVAPLLAVYLYRLIRRRDPLRWPMALFLVGALGNTIDRVLFRTVTDFVDVDFPDLIMERWAVFNVADSCITIGITLLLIQILFLHHPDRSARKAETHDRLTASHTLPPDDGSRPTSAAD